MFMLIQPHLYSPPQFATVQEIIKHSAIEYPNRYALRDLAENPISSLTYRQLYTEILRFGSALQSLGLKERSHIAIIGENRTQWGLSFLTCFAFNYVAVPVDKALTAGEIVNILFEAEAEAVIFSGNYEDVLIEHKHSLKKLKHLICMDKTKAFGEIHIMNQLLSSVESIESVTLPKINPDDLAEIIFTSGSLGRAKGVMLSQGNIAANIVGMTSVLEIKSDDRFLSVLPMHHTYESTCGFLCPIASGSCVYFSRSLKTIADDMMTAKPTVFLGVPLLYDKMFRRIAQALKDDKLKQLLTTALVRVTNVAERFGVSGLKKKLFKVLHEKFGGAIRLFIVGGAAPDARVLTGLREFGFTIRQGYGLTETSPILTVNRIEAFRDDSAGLPLPGVKIAIDSPDENGVGEVKAKGGNVMLGYYKNDKATSDVVKDGWFYTGDLGCVDENGFLYIRGRKKNVIISKSGKNIFPEEIEDLLLKSPYILEAIVYGEEDAKHDEIIAVQIVADTDAFIEHANKKGEKITDEMIRLVLSDEIAKVNKQLAAFKHIKKFTTRQEEFEKTTTQKIKRYLVKH